MAKRPRLAKPDPGETLPATAQSRALSSLSCPLCPVGKAHRGSPSSIAHHQRVNHPGRGNDLLKPMAGSALPRYEVCSQCGNLVTNRNRHEEICKRRAGPPLPKSSAGPTIASTRALPQSELTRPHATSRTLPRSSHPPRDATPQGDESPTPPRQSPLRRRINPPGNDPSATAGPTITDSPALLESPAQCDPRSGTASGPTPLHRTPTPSPTDPAPQEPTTAPLPSPCSQPRVAARQREHSPAPPHRSPPRT